MPPAWGLRRTTVSSSGSSIAAKEEHPGKKQKSDGKQVYSRRARAILTQDDKSKYSLVNDSDPQRFMTVVVKGLLNCSQRLRTIEGVLQDVLIIDSGHDIVKELAATMRPYQESCKQQGSGYDLGPPVPHLWSTFLDCLIKFDIGHQNRTDLQVVKELVDNSTDPETVFEHCRHIHCKGCYDKKIHKLTMMIPDRNSRHAVVKAMNQLQVTILYP